MSEVHAVLRAVEVVTGVPAKDMLGRSRVAKVAEARALAMTQLRKLKWTYVEIGAEFERDHTTVMSNVDTFGWRCLASPSVAKKYKASTTMIRAMLADKSLGTLTVRDQKKNKDAERCLL